MLIVPITTVETLLFSGLLLTWAIFLFGGFIIGHAQATATRRMPLWTRMASSATLTTTAWLWAAISLGTQANALAICVALGMSASMVGDLFMAELFPVPQPVIPGIIAFGIGHLFYISGVWFISNQFPSDMLYLREYTLLAWLGIGGVGWLLAIFPAQKRRRVHYLALPYTLLLSGTVGLSMGLALHDSAFWLMTLGAILFLLSDLLLGLQLFRNVHFRYIGDVVWLLYSPGQMLIVLGVVLYTVVVAPTVIS